MAFVYRKERVTEISPNKEEFDVGPGQYLPIFDNQTNKPNKVPFLAASQRVGLLEQAEKQEGPGPGAYYHDEIFEKIYKNLKKDRDQRIEKAGDLKALEKIHSMTSAEGFPSMMLKKNAEALGFLGKDCRFKEKDEEITPGPGHYLKSNLGKHSPTNNFRVIPKKEKIDPLSKAVSIPAKNQGFGYEIEDELNVLMNEDPEKIKKFKGEKNDTVGPGNYNIDQPDVWLKKGGAQWSKSKTKKTLFGINQKEDKPKSKLGVPLVAQSINTKLSKSFEVDIRDIQNNMKIVHERSSSASLKKTLDPKNILKSNQIRKNNRKEIIEMMTQKEPVDMFGTFQKKFASGTPGPGYYYDDRMTSGFKSAKYPEYKQNFQSNLQRFPDENKNLTVGPGTYFSEKNIEQKYLKENKKGKVYPITTIAKEPIEKYIEINPGPGQYDTSSSFRNTKRNLSNYNFGSTEKRFVDMNKTSKVVTPGPGSYIETASTFYTTKEKWVNLKTKNRDPSNMMKRALTTKTIRQGIGRTNLPRSQFDNQGQSKDIIPSVGTYNPETMFTIDYKVKKNSHKFGFSEAAFNSSITQNRFEIKKDEFSLGPGFYYKDKKQNLAQVFPPFNSNEKRKTIEVKNDPMISTGPGIYNQNSYFDWNKKTFNILYL